MDREGCAALPRGRKTDTFEVAAEKLTFLSFRAKRGISPGFKSNTQRDSSAKNAPRNENMKARLLPAAVRCTVGKPESKGAAHERVYRVGFAPALQLGGPGRPLGKESEPSAGSRSGSSADVSEPLRAGNAGGGGSDGELVLDRRGD